MRKAYIATIQLVLEVDSEANACDFISETLRELDGVIDWQYLPVGGQLLSPIETFVSSSDDYDEGDAFSAFPRKISKTP